MKTFIFDKWILLCFFALISIGLIMVASASMVISDQQYNLPFHYLFRQLFYSIAGCFLMLCITRVTMDKWYQYSRYFILIGIVLLAMVLLPKIGMTVNGSRRWLHLGFITIQVSEMVKLAAILFLAGYLHRHQQEVRTQFSGFVKPMIVLGVMSVFLLLEPDFGAVSILIAIFLILLFLANVRLAAFILLFVCVAAGMAILAIKSPYRLQRLTTFLNPWGSQFGSGYQLTQSLMAFGRGGIFGTGLGNSVQKLFYLPEAHTDFLFAVIAEELGLVGECVIIGIFAMLVGRIFWLSKRAFQYDALFIAYVAAGIGVWFGLQAMINIGVNAGILPTKGLTLPFISYGGSSMLMNCAVIGILLRISYEIREPNALMRVKPPAPKVSIQRKSQVFSRARA